MVRAAGVQRRRHRPAAPESAAAFPVEHAPARILELQRACGNQAVARLVTQRRTLQRVILGPERKDIWTTEIAERVSKETDAPLKDKIQKLHGHAKEVVVSGYDDLVARVHAGEFDELLAGTRVVRVGRHQFEISATKVTTTRDLAHRLAGAASVDVDRLERALSNNDVAQFNRDEPLSSKALEEFLNKQFKPEPVIDVDGLARRLLQEKGLDSTLDALVARMRAALQPDDVRKYNEGDGLGKKANNLLTDSGVMSLRLLQDDLLLRPWLRDMYELGGDETAVGLELSTPEEANTRLELGHLDRVTAKKKGTNLAIGAIRDSLVKSSGPIAFTLVGHVNFGGKDASGWTVGGLTAATIADALFQGLQLAAEDAELAQLNLLSCGTEQFARILLGELKTRNVHVYLCTAFLDEIPVNPGPLGAPQQDFLYAGDADAYRRREAQNIGSSVSFIKPTGHGKDLRAFAEQRLSRILVKAFLETFPLAPMTPPPEVLALIAAYALPDRPTAQEMNKLRRD